MGYINCKKKFKYLSGRTNLERKIKTIRDFQIFFKNILYVSPRTMIRHSWLILPTSRNGP